MPRKSTLPDDPVTSYAKRVVDGEIAAGPHVRGACQRHIDDLTNARGLVFDIGAAKRAIEFFPDVLRLSGGQFEGQPFELLDWQAFIVGSLFGWMGDDGFRRFRVAYIETGKGSGKSPLAAGIGLYMLIADDEPRAEVYAAATKKDQAKVLFRDAVAMVEQSPELDGLLNLAGGVEKQNIAYLEKGSFFRPISTEERGRGQSGPRPHCGILDEVHEHPTNAMVEFMRAGTKGRRQALILMITNSGADRQSVCREYHEYTAKVCAGELEDDSHFGYVCAVDENEDPLKDEGCWQKANPSLGITFEKKYLREQVRAALGMPSKENIVRRLNFCQWTDAEQVWISRHLWEACEYEFDLSELQGRTCAGGLDLSSKLDLTALAMAWNVEAGEFGLEDDGVVAALWFWTPSDTLNDREDKDRVPYRRWISDGHLISVPGRAIDYRYVTAELAELYSKFDVSLVNYDRWRIEDLKRELDSEGIPIELEPFGQGFKDMSPAVDRLEELVVSNRLRILVNPVLRWNAASAVLQTDPAGNRKFAKDKATGRIDGLVALTMAVDGVDQAPIVAPSPWEDPDYRISM